MTDPGRVKLAQDFLTDAGWGEALRVPLAGDASARRYERLAQRDTTAILMDCTPETGEDPRRFARMADWLLAQGFSAPRILARDEPNGFLLLEDLGDDLFARLTAANPAAEPALYTAAADFLAELQRCPVPDFVQPLDGPALAALTEWIGDWYLPAFGSPSETTIPEVVAALYARLGADTAPVLSLRDFHAENLIWLPDRQGHARLGLLDFQDAVAAHPAYDLVSLLQDARRDVTAATEAAAIECFIARTGWNRDAFGAIYALLGAQRALRILAVFARLCVHLGRPRYLGYMPRVWRALQRNLAHPALAELAYAAQRLPEPTPDAIARLKEKAPCPTR